MLTLEEMIIQAKKADASDIHLIVNLPPKYRVNGQLVNICEDQMTEDDCFGIAQELSGNRFDELMVAGELDSSKTFSGIRCRIHLFKQRGIPSLALRLLADRIPDLNQLNLPPSVPQLTELHKGIVLITGETGSGKSTSLAALLDAINHTRRDHIVTLEDPIEYIYEPDLCIINQREVGTDTESFAKGLRASLREDPNVILIGEMRDKETIETAITAAETGHLVFGTLHTGSAADSIDRMVQVFPGDMQQQIRLQLSTTLVAVLCQQLLPGRSGGRVLACEYMIVTDAIKNLIRTGNTPQISNAVATSASIGGQTMDQSIQRLLKERKISKEVALRYAHDKRLLKGSEFY